jgi:hypothetical protein
MAFGFRKMATPVIKPDRYDRFHFNSPSLSVFQYRRSPTITMS